MHTDSKQTPNARVDEAAWSAVLSSGLWRYAVAVVATSSALGLTAVLWPHTVRIPFLFYFAAVMLSAWYGGLGPGLFAMSMAIAGSIYFVLPPWQAFGVTAPEDLFRLGLFLLVAVFISVLNDRRKRATESERRQREYLQVILDSIGDAVIVTDANGAVTFLNRVAETVTGWTMVEAVGKHLPEVFPIINEETRQPVGNPVTTVQQTRTVVGLADHTILCTKDGRELPIDDSAAPIYNAQGHFIGAVLVFRDITTRRQAELTSLQLATIVASSDDAIISKSLDGVVTSWNAAAQQLFGYSAEEMIGQPIMRLLPQDRQDEEEKILARLQKGEHLYHFETVRRTKDGRLLDVSVTISPLQNSHGVIIGASKIARDITARKQAEHERTRLITELQASNQELDAFAYIASHDLKEPLRGIATYATFLQEEEAAQLSPQGQTRLRTIQQLVQRMETLLTSLLHYSRVGRVVLEVQPVNLQHVVQQTLEVLQHRIVESGVQIRLPQVLPTVLCNQVWVSEIFLNLISNAIKYNDKAEKWVEIGVQAENPLVLYVRDNGIGIAPERQTMIFEIFRRLHGRDAYGGGLGAGLTITKRMIERHGGRIWLESTPGEGTTFFFTLAKEGDLVQGN